MMAVFGFSPLKAAVWTVGVNIVLYFIAEICLSEARSTALRACAAMAAAHAVAYGLLFVLPSIEVAALYIGCILLVLFAGRSDKYPTVVFIRERVSVLIDALRNGAMGTLDVALACASAGIIIGMLMLTGLGLRISGLLVDLSGGNLPLLLVLTMVASLILGMGLPTLGDRKSTRLNSSH